MAWASIPPCSSRPGYFYGKLGHPVRAFLWAAAGKAKVCLLPLVLIGDILSPGGIWLSGFFTYANRERSGVFIDSNRERSFTY